MATQKIEKSIVVNAPKENIWGVEICGSQSKVIRRLNISKRCAPLWDKALDKVKELAENGTY